ncbi:hypothetical protein L3X38_017660 [Prunus dulcis]|uniref:Uncharacterized protein n=1 Tax=Prunus dulcis TaxID=3755 RepID=A0AAD4W9A9_PRUDU|nr:hypothetical protein L3X38_017660 [Prunus dulcis]
MKDGSKGVGFVVRDPNGELTWSCGYASSWHGVYPCHGAQHAEEWVTLCIGRRICAPDYLNVAQLINNKQVCLAPEGSSAEKIRTLLQQLPSTVLSYPAKLILCSSYCTVWPP